MCQGNLINYVRLLGDWRQAHASDFNGLVQGHAYTITGKVIFYETYAKLLTSNSLGLKCEKTLGSSIFPPFTLSKSQATLG